MIFLPLVLGIGPLNSGTNDFQKHLNDHFYNLKNKNIFVFQNKTFVYYLFHELKKNLIPNIFLFIIYIYSRTEKFFVRSYLKLCSMIALKKFNLSWSLNNRM